MSKRDLKKSLKANTLHTHLPFASLNTHWQVEAMTKLSITIAYTSTSPHKLHLETERGRWQKRRERQMRCGWDMKMGIVVQLLSCFGWKRGLLIQKSIPIRQVELKSSSLVEQSSQAPGENRTVEYLQGIFNNRQSRSCTETGGQGGFMSSHCGL